MQRRLLDCLLVVLCWTSLASASKALEPLPLEIRGSQVGAWVEVPGFAARLVLELEAAVGLVPENLGLSVSAIDAEQLRPRLPAGVELPGRSAALIQFVPPAHRGLSMSGTYVLQLDTRGVRYRDQGSLRLFKALPDGQFEDATTALGGGIDLWLRGEGEGAAEWLVAVDRRPARSLVERKFDRLEALTAEAAPQPAAPQPAAPQPAAPQPAAIRAELWTMLGAARLAWNEASQGSDRTAPRRAAAEIDAFLRAVAGYSGSALPDVWRSCGDLRNVAGELRATARTLRFSLALAGQGIERDTISQPEE